jgi:hypothetical protein
MDDSDVRPQQLIPKLVIWNCECTSFNQVINVALVKVFWRRSDVGGQGRRRLTACSIAQSTTSAQERLIAVGMHCGSLACLRRD